MAKDSGLNPALFNFYKIYLILMFSVVHYN